MPNLKKAALFVLLVPGLCLAGNRDIHDLASKADRGGRAGAKVSRQDRVSIGRILWELARDIRSAPSSLKKTQNGRIL